MTQIKVSVIVAVFNAEKTLNRCLDSLSAQTIDSIEFICIDDGSTDTSPSILDSYAAQDNRFQVFHKQNEGVSATRQFGMEHAHGEFIIHLDSDDYVENDAYRLLYETATSNPAEPADMVICNAYRITSNGIQVMDYSAKDLSAKALAERMFSWETSALWNRLIRAQVISRYNLRFPSSLSLAEDCYFLVSLLDRSIKEGDSLKILHLDKALVHYDNIVNPNSLTRTSGSSGSLFALHIKPYKLLMRELDMNVFGKAFYSFISSMAFLAYWRLDKEGLCDYANLFLPFRDGIKRYVPNSVSKRLVLLALRIGGPRAYYFKWLAVPSILLDKFSLQTHHSE